MSTTTEPAAREQTAPAPQQPPSADSALSQRWERIGLSIGAIVGVLVIPLLLQVSDGAALSVARVLTGALLGAALFAGKAWVQNRDRHTLTTLALAGAFLGAVLGAFLLQYLELPFRVVIVAGKIGGAVTGGLAGVLLGRFLAERQQPASAV